jgi:DNA-binding MarR family transcriptional regulator
MYEEGSAPPAARARKPARDGRPKGEAGDRFAVLNSFVDFTMAGLTRNEIPVWLILYRDTRDGSVSVSQGNIARRAGVTARTVRRVLARLAARGLVKILKRGGLQTGPSRYQVTAQGKEPS